MAEHRIGRIAPAIDSCNSLATIFSFLGLPLNLHHFYHYLHYALHSHRKYRFRHQFSTRHPTLMSTYYPLTPFDSHDLPVGHRRKERTSSLKTRKIRDQVMFVEYSLTSHLRRKMVGQQLSKVEVDGCYSSKHVYCRAYGSHSRF